MDDLGSARESSRYFTPLNRSQSNRSFLTRSFSSRKTTESGDAYNDRNPIGLTTIHSPAKESEADIIFIHGLGGGSRTSWCKDGDLSLFWPQAWLPQDAAFKNTRIHTFGYDSKWVNNSLLNIHDFAKSLLEWMENCPTMPSSEDVGSISQLVFRPHLSGGERVQES